MAVHDSPMARLDSSSIRYVKYFFQFEVQTSSFELFQSIEQGVLRKVVRSAAWGPLLDCA